MWANIFLLFCLSLTPVATEWVAEEYGHEWPAATYGVVALAAALSYTLLARMLVRADRTNSFVAGALGADLKSLVTLALLAVGIGLAFVDWALAYAAYVIVSAIWFIPDRRLAKRIGD
jgi:uncharacterized membrane protein